MMNVQGAPAIPGSGAAKNITSKDPLLATSELKDIIAGGTPKLPKPSRSFRGNSQSRVIEKEMVLPPSTGSRMGNTILQQKSQMGHDDTRASGAGTGLSDSASKSKGKGKVAAGHSRMKSSSGLAPSLKKSVTQGSASMGADELDANQIVSSSSASMKAAGDTSDSDPEDVVTARQLLMDPQAYSKPPDTFSAMDLTPEETALLERFNIGSRGRDPPGKEPAKEQPEFKSTFLADFFDKGQKQVELIEQQERMRQKLAKYNKGKVPQQPQVQTVTRPPLKSKAHRVHFEEPEEEKKQVEVSAEEEARLTTQEITEGVRLAREALNAPPTDLLEFEKQLKAKHDELKAAGISPVLQSVGSATKSQPGEQANPRPRYKVAFSKKTKKF